MTHFRKLPFGKQVGRKIYFHSFVTRSMPDDIQYDVMRAAKLRENYIQRVRPKLRREWRRAQAIGYVVSVTPKERVAFLYYPGFWTHGHPVLVESTTVNLVTERICVRQYAFNLPVLHRKEMMIPKWHEFYKRFARLTKAEEKAGLLDRCYLVGRNDAWQKRLLSRGYTVRGHQLLKISPDRHELRR